MKEQPGWGPAHQSDRCKSARYASTTTRTEPHTVGLSLHSTNPDMFGSTVRFINGAPSATPTPAMSIRHGVIPMSEVAASA